MKRKTFTLQKVISRYTGSQPTMAICNAFLVLIADLLHTYHTHHLFLAMAICDTFPVLIANLLHYATEAKI